MLESLTEYFSSRFFMPHGHCYLWKPELLWLQVLSNGLIGAAYVAISTTLAYLVFKIRDIPFKRMYVAFGVFIVTCGITHFMDIYVVWTPSYWTDGMIRAVTALASVGTALLLPPLVPKAVAIARGAKAAHDKGVKLESLVKDLGTMYERTKELEQLKTQFFANVSHELRTPLALIVAPVDKLLAAGNLSEEQRRELEMVARNARSLLRQVNDLLDLSKLEAGKMDLQYSRTDMARLVRVTAANFESLARERQVDFTVNAPSELPAVVDNDKVQRVLLNLLSNAFKFTPAGGHIRCDVEKGGTGEVTIAVADSGPGIKTEHREVVFERFRQVEGGATRRYGGTGLGLAIVKDFVSMHRGRVQVADAPEGGALFRVQLPVQAPAGAQVENAPRGAEESSVLATRQIVEELRAQDNKDSKPATRSGPGRSRVLVVEDNREMSRFIAEALGDDYEVHTADAGDEGLRRARELSPALVISDMMMPGMSGEDLVREMRGDSVLEQTPVIMLTAKADEESRIRLLRAGAQDYLVKPFALEELRARVAIQVQMRRARDLLQQEIAAQEQDLERMITELAHQKHELQRALGSLRVAHEQAERALQVKSEFLLLASHELRTPLTSLGLHLQTLRLRLKDHPSEDVQRVLRRLGDSAQRLVDLVESLLEYGRIDRGRLSVERTAVDPVQVARAAVDDQRSQAEQKGLTLQLETASAMPTLHTDARLLRLMLDNLVGNAIKFTSSGGVTVRVRSAADRFTFEVEDTGPGIAAEDLPRIFEPFTHLEPLKGKHTPGFGLGLALVKQMADALGAKVDVRSAPGAGATFIVQITSDTVS